MVESHRHMATEKKYKHGRHKKNSRYKRGQGIWTRCSKAERSTNQTDRVQMYRKQATHKHIGICVLLLLTTTPAAHRKWMKQSGGKAFFGVRMDGFHFGCIFFVIRLGVRNEHTQKTHTHSSSSSQISICIVAVCICLVIGVRTVCFFVPFFLLSFVLFSMCICIYWTIALLLAFFFTFKSYGKKLTQTVLLCMEYTELILCKRRRALLVLVAVITKLIPWIFHSCIKRDRQRERESNDRKHLKLKKSRTRCSNKW